MFLVSLLLVEFLTTFRQSWRAKVSDDHVLNRQQSVSTDQRKKVRRTLLSLVFREMVGLGASSTISEVGLLLQLLSTGSSGSLKSWFRCCGGLLFNFGPLE